MYWTKSPNYLKRPIIHRDKKAFKPKMAKSKIYFASVLTNYYSKTGLRQILSKIFSNQIIFLKIINKS